MTDCAASRNWITPSSGATPRPQTPIRRAVGHAVERVVTFLPMVSKTAAAPVDDRLRGAGKRAQQPPYRRARTRTSDAAWGALDRPRRPGVFGSTERRRP